MYSIWPVMLLHSFWASSFTLSYNSGLSLIDVLYICFFNYITSGALYFFKVAL